MQLAVISVLLCLVAIGAVRIVADRRALGRLRAHDPQTLFECAPVPLWEEDLSALRPLLLDLTERGVDIEAHFAEHPDELIRTANRIRVLAVNHAARDLYGLGNAAPHRLRIGAVLGTEEARATCARKLARLAAGDARFVEETTVTAADGSVRRIEVHLLVPPDQRETWSRVLVATTDISERQKTQLAAEAAARLEATATLAGGFAHDINNLLVSVIGNASVLRESGTGDREQSALCDEIIRAGEKAANVAGQLVSYARGGRYMPRLLRLAEVVARVVGQREATEPGEPAAAVEIPPDLWPVLGDRRQIEQVLGHLLANASEATPGGGRIAIRLQNELLTALDAERSEILREGRYVRLMVEDAGEGMPDEVRARAFDPFFTTRFQGRGLGLAAVYGIVHNHGGDVAIESAVGVGTRVIVRLPAAPLELVEREKPVREHPRAAPGARAPRSAPCILLVDDDASVRRVAAAILRRGGYRAVEAGHGKEALERLKEGPFAAVLLDLEMPVLGGRETLTRLRGAAPDLPIIVSTGYEITDPETLTRLGATAFLPKPYRPARLLALLRDLTMREAALDPEPAPPTLEAAEAAKAR